MSLMLVFCRSFNNNNAIRKINEEGEIFDLRINKLNLPSNEMSNVEGG